MGHGTIDGASIMPHNLFPYARAAFLSDFVIVICARKSHGDAALTTCDFLTEENIKVMEFPDQNPDCQYISSKSGIFYSHLFHILLILMYWLNYSSKTAAYSFSYRS